MTGAQDVVNATESDNTSSVTFCVESLDNGVVRVYWVAIRAPGDMGGERLAYPLTGAQRDAICEAFSMAGVSTSHVSVFDGCVSYVSPGVTRYAVWLTG